MLNYFSVANFKDKADGKNFMDLKVFIHFFSQILTELLYAIRKHFYA